MTGIRPTFNLPQGLADADAPITSVQDLVAFIAAGSRTDGSAYVGVELERVPMRADGTAAPHASGEGGDVVSLLARLESHHGWTRVEQDGHVMGLRRGDANVHLEPGSQVELALPPVRTAREVRAALADWDRELAEAGAAVGVHALPIGLQPVTPIEEIAWVPRDRYRIMREHLGRRGRLAHHMMKATAGVQFTVDFANETHAAEIVSAAISTEAPVLALVASSPLEGGRPAGCHSRRPAIWAETDPARTGLLPWVHEEGYEHARYVRWALGIPCMFVVREGRWVDGGGVSFERMLEDGIPGGGPVRLSDWALHLTTLFPEVRVKQQIEIRGADSCPVELNAALAALWRGLLYDDEARREAIALTSGWSRADRLASHEAAGIHGLDARVPGTTLRELAREIVAIASRALARLDPLDAELLEPLRAIAWHGHSPSVALLRDWEREGPASLLRRT